jgi:hypothetical protein
MTVANTPLFNIPYPDSGSFLRQIPAYMKALAEGVEAALRAAGVPAATNPDRVVASSDAARNAHFGVPGTVAAQRTLQTRGAECVRPDLGWVERYFGKYDAATNAGGVQYGPAGWYPVGGKLPGVLATAATSVMPATVGAAKPLTFASALYNRGVTYNPSTGVATITKAGVYQISGAMRVSSVAGDVRLYISVNGTTVAIQAVTAVIGTNISEALPLDVGDTVSVDIYQTSGTAVTVNATQRAFSLSYLNPA